MTLRYSLAATVAAVVIAGGIGPCLPDTTTIDFETPALGGTPYQVIGPSYVVAQISFTGGVVALAECGVANQALGLNPPHWDVGYEGFRVDFPPPPSDPVTVVSVGVDSYLGAFGGSTVGLHLYGETGELIGGASREVFEGEGPCRRAGSTLTASTFERVARAVIKIDAPPPTDACEASGCSGPLWIDNFTFGDCLDSEPPMLTVTATPSNLWPPNHTMAGIHVDVDVEDDCDEAPQVVLASITSDEPDSGTGIGDTPGDIQEADVGTADFDFLVRAERAELGDGRSYSICYEARDSSGKVASACSFVGIPHDRRRRIPTIGTGDVHRRHGREALFPAPIEEAAGREREAARAGVIPLHGQVCPAPAAEPAEELGAESHRGALSLEADCPSNATESEPTLLERCQALRLQYQEALSDAKRCRPGRAARLQQCSLPVEDDLHCPCLRFVSPTNTSALETMGDLKAEWDALACEGLFQCSAGLCANPRSATCPAGIFLNSAPPVCINHW